VIKILSMLTVTMLVWGLAVSVAYAEQEAAERPKGAGAGGFLFGMNRVDFDALSSKLAAQGFEELEAENTFFGGAGYGVIGDKIIIGGEGGGFGQDVSSDTLKASVGYGYGLFKVGYVIYSKGSLRVFPLFGMGGGGINLRIADTGGAPGFDALVKDPGREVNLSAGGLLFDLGLGMDYLLLLGGDEKGEGGLLFGVRAGYTLSPTKTDWRMTDRDVLRGPDVRITGPYVHLMFGGGGREK